MENFWKAAAIAILTVILGAAIGKKEKDIAVVLSTAACCILGIMAIRYLSDVVDFLWKLSGSLDYKHPFTGILLRIAGVALISELTGLISADSGNGSLERIMHLLGTSVMLSLALPVFESFFNVVQEILNII